MFKKRILIISPHPDDETLGVGGTIAKYSDAGHEINVLTISGHLPPLYKRNDYEITITSLDDDTEHYFTICVEFEDEDDDEKIICGDVEDFETDRD